MKGESKYLGNTYDGFTVVGYYKKNDYKNQYGKDTKPTYHRSYDYNLYNYETQQHLTLSGNQLRLLQSGKRTITDMLSTNAHASRNPRINAYLRWIRA